MLIFRKDFVCMCNHTYNNIRDIYVVNIYLLFRSVIFNTCELKRGIMLENIEHSVKHISFIISKLNWILSHIRWIIGIMYHFLIARFTSKINVNI